LVSIIGSAILIVFLVGFRLVLRQESLEMEWVSTVALVSGLMWLTFSSVAQSMELRARIPSAADSLRLELTGACIADGAAPRTLARGVARKLALQVTDFPNSLKVRGLSGHKSIIIRSFDESQIFAHSAAQVRGRPKRGSQLPYRFWSHPGSQIEFLRTKIMSHAHTFNALRPDRNGLCHLLFACTLLMAFAAAPLHAQYIYQDVHDFNCLTADGCGSESRGRLVEGSDLYLYGTAEGGTKGGIIFKISPDGATFVKLWDFDGPKTGSGPNAQLTLASDGHFYGTTTLGGKFDSGTLFRFGSKGSASPGPPTVLHHFTVTEGFDSSIPPIQGKDGDLYGVTGLGVTYTFNLATQTYQLLTKSTPGASLGPLLLASNGLLYGVADQSGTSIHGSLYSLATPGGAVHAVHNFTGADGDNPQGPLIDLPNPRCKPAMRCILLFGTTVGGGANGNGVVFVAAPSGAVNVLHNFGALSGGINNDGANPFAGLQLGPDGQLLGVSFNGGADGIGTIFEISTSGVFTKLFDFTAINPPAQGVSPVTTLIQHTNGCLYGVTEAGTVAQGSGNVYSLCPENPPPFLIVEGPIFVAPGVPVQIIGSNMGEVSTIAFGGVQAQIQSRSDTFLTAIVPVNAIDGLVTATFPSGARVQSETQMYILPMIHNLDPSSGPVGALVAIVGGGFVGTTRVTFGGVAATSFTVLTPAMIRATVPTGAKTGKVTVTTPNGTAVSKEIFTVN
jgi:uncharacterized repeat protein (TIGR03803 family)